MPPRRPTIRQSRPCRTTWTPRRASQPRSSKPSSGPRGAAMVARSSSTAPCGGERPSGSSSSTRSRSRRSSKRRTSAGSRSANVDRRTGPVTTAVTAAERPISGRSTLASRASSRALPHHQPASASASAQAGSRALGIVVAPAASATSTIAPDAGARVAFARASPVHAASTSSVGQVRSIRETPGPVAARRAQVRCRGSHRDRRPRESRRAPRGSRESSGRSPVRSRAERRARPRSQS